MWPTLWLVVGGWRLLVVVVVVVVVEEFVQDPELVRNLKVCPLLTFPQSGSAD